MSPICKNGIDEFLEHTTRNSESDNLIFWAICEDQRVAINVSIESIQDFHPEDKTNPDEKFQIYRSEFERIAEKKILNGENNPYISTADFN